MTFLCTQALSKSIDSLYDERLHLLDHQPEEGQCNPDECKIREDLDIGFGRVHGMQGLSLDITTNLVPGSAFIKREVVMMDHLNFKLEHSGHIHQSPFKT